MRMFDSVIVDCPKCDKELKIAANKLGLYDSADFIRSKSNSFGPISN